MLDLSKLKLHIQKFNSEALEAYNDFKSVEEMLSTLKRSSFLFKKDGFCIVWDCETREIKISEEGEESYSSPWSKVKPDFMMKFAPLLPEFIEAICEGKV
jgi:hypothetical protein